MSKSEENELQLKSLIFKINCFDALRRMKVTQFGSLTLSVTHDPWPLLPERNPFLYRDAWEDINFFCLAFLREGVQNTARGR